MRSQVHDGQPSARCLRDGIPFGHANAHAGQLLRRAGVGFAGGVGRGTGVVFGRGVAGGVASTRGSSRPARRSFLVFGSRTMWIVAPVHA